MKIVAHTEDGRFLVAKSDREDADAVVVAGGRASPVMPAGSLTAQGEADEWLPGSGDADRQRILRVLEVASGPLG